MGLIVFNELKLEDFFEACVDRILRASITPIAHYGFMIFVIAHSHYNHYRGTKGGTIPRVHVFKGLDFCTQLDIFFLVVNFLGFCLKEVPNLFCSQECSCNSIDYVISV